MSSISIETSGFLPKDAAERERDLIRKVNLSRSYIFVEPLQEFLEAVKQRILEGSPGTIWTHNYTKASYDAVYTKFKKSGDEFELIPGIHTDYAKFFADGTPRGTVVPLEKMRAWAISKIGPGEDAEKLARKVKKSIAQEGSGAYPIVDDLWDLYSEKYHAEVRKRLKEFTK